MKLTILYILFSFSMMLNAQTQTEKFKIINDGKQIGTLEATITNQGNETIYTSHTSLEYNLLVAIKIVYDYDVTFINNYLKEASVRIVVRGNDKTNVKTIKDENEYKFFSEADLKTTIKDPITYSVVQLFFKEPVGITKIYAEEHGEFHTLKKIADHVYLKTTPKGQQNIYYFKNNKLQKCDANAGIIKFSIIRLEN